MNHRLVEMAATAAVFLNPAKDVRVRKNSGAAYSIPLMSLEKANHDDIALLIRLYAGHLDRFFAVAEDFDEPADVRSYAVTFAIGMSFGDIAKASLRQAENYRKLPVLQRNFAAESASIAKAVQSTLPVPAILERLMRLAEDCDQDSDVREQAICMFDRIAVEAEQVFGIKTNREMFDDRFIAIALAAPEKRLTNYALTLGCK